MTPAMCGITCKAQNKGDYFAIQNGATCYCSNSLAGMTRFGLAAVTSVGGSNANYWYKFKPPGRVTPSLLPNACTHVPIT